MKDVILLGTARCGKTTFANNLSKELNYCIIPIDSFVEAFQVAFPNFGIYHKNTEFKFKNLPKFISTHYKKIKNDYPERNFIIEGWHVFPSELFKYLNKEDFVVACVGYPNQDPKEKLKLLRKYTYENDYCKYLTDDELIHNTLKHIDFATQMQKECLAEGIPYFDLSTDWDKTQNKLKNYIYSSVQEETTK